MNTPDRYTAPSGMLMAFDVNTMAERASRDLGGQLDSTTTAPDGSDGVDKLKVW